MSLIVLNEDGSGSWNGAGTWELNYSTISGENNSAAAGAA